MARQIGNLAVSGDQESSRPWREWHGWYSPGRSPGPPTRFGNFV